MIDEFQDTLFTVGISCRFEEQSVNGSLQPGGGDVKQSIYRWQFGLESAGKSGMRISSMKIYKKKI